MRSGSTPKPWLAARASPESLSRMRLKTGVGISCSFQSLVLQFLVTGRMPIAYTRASPETRNRAPKLPLLRFLFRLGDGDGLARLAHLEAREAADRDVLAQLADLGGDQLADADGLVLDEGLLEQADFFVELAPSCLRRSFRPCSAACRWRRPGRDRFPSRARKPRA